MKKYDYVNEIKKSTKNIDFDESTKRLFEDYVDFEKSSAEKLLNIINNSNRENFEKINPKEIEFIYTGCIDNERTQNMCYIYENNKDGASLGYVYLECGEPHYETAEYADIPDHTNFVKQFLNLAYAVGAEFTEGEPKNLKKYNYIVRLKDESFYHLTFNVNDAGSYFHILCARYLSYNISIYNRKIIKNKNQTELDKLINKSEESKNLYLNAKEMFDNFDFLYAVMKSLNSKKKIKIFNTCIDKNESYLNHHYMDNLLNYVDTATSFVRWGCPKEVIFLQDIAENRKETELGKELYDKLTSLYDNKFTAIEMFTILRTEKMQKEMLKFLNSGETDKSKIYSKYVNIYTNE